MSFKHEVESIEIPKQLSMRSREGIQKAELENKKPNFKRFIQVFAASAVMIIVIVFASDSSLANSIKGFFADLTKWNGTVIGTTYENATDEIIVTAEKLEGKRYLLTVNFVEMDKTPFNLVEILEIGDYEFLRGGKKIDLNSVFVDDVVDTKTLIIENKELLFNFNGSIYEKTLRINEDVDTLLINSFFFHSAGDAPLIVKGKWEIPLNKQK